MIELQAVSFTFSLQQLVAMGIPVVSAIIGGAASVWKLFNRIHSIENKVTQEQRVNAKYFELFESSLATANIQSMEARDLIISVAAKLDVPNKFDREFWHKKAEAERRAHKERLENDL